MTLLKLIRTMEEAATVEPLTTAADLKEKSAEDIKGYMHWLIQNASMTWTYTIPRDVKIKHGFGI